MSETKSGDGWRPRPRPRGGARAIGAFATRLLDPIARARGFATISLLSEWPAIAGHDLAQFTMPDKVIWPRRRQDEDSAGAAPTHQTEAATLILRVDGPRAIEVQHRADQIIERVNTYFGYRAIGALRILQAPVARVRRAPSPSPPPPLDPQPLPASAEIDDDNLRQALMRLGTAVRSRASRR